MTERLRNQMSRLPTQLLLAIIGVLLFIPLNGNVHLFDWDEINFAESAREMLLTGNYRFVQINFQPFYEKPPLFIWLQALSMNYLGVNEFAARLPNAVCGIITMLTVYQAGKSVFNFRLGVLWALFFACSILPHLYFKSGIIDPVFNLFIFLGIFYMYQLTIENDFEDFRTRRKNRRWNLFFSALFIGLATLTKGPVAILLTVLTASVYFFVNRGKLKIEFSEMFLWWVGVATVVIAWLSFEIRANGVRFVNEFITYQIRLFSTEDAGHGGPFFYHLIVLLIGVFPASALIYDSFRKNIHDSTEQVNFKRWMIYLLLVVLGVFSIVKTKVIHYSSLCYFPITFLAAYYLNYLLESKAKWTWRQSLPVVFVGFVITAALTAGILVMRNPEVLPHFIKLDDFARECLRAKVYWSDKEIRFGIIYLICITISVMLMYTRHIHWGIYILIISSSLFIGTVMTFIVPRVEKYSQAALIEFLESKQSEVCIIETAGFKSYAHYFYARKPVPSADDDFKTHYVIAKITKADEVRGWYPNLTELYRKNGWVFFRK